MEFFGRDLVKKIQDSELEGELAHAIYSPPYRQLFTYEEILQKNPKFAAVNIVLYRKEDGWHFPLIVRSKNERDRHSGQISLPGGKKEATDRDFEHTAKRETSEELGIEEPYIRIIREMSPIYIPPSNFYVRPFISYTKRNPQFFLQESEAVELIEFPLNSILNLTEQPQMMVLPSSQGTEVPVIDFNGYLIWGATSMILSEFSKLMKKL
ncbi:NUDIX hydrolase [Chryseobacterium sp. MFBS3-17]|uniref:NUDIX hydrolase n=1 Tax=Chryseobacterium sp. MFBS3-17 TaxID=2886689 RepID=UPI001D0F07AD|nr:CoA pyrophosphatase [Chryseobacterium sp. MFBS3-17]MCC2591396.1 CoA pyrophosphatase [Chryseobacterium sp. MFBS3-17]